MHQQCCASFGDSYQVRRLPHGRLPKQGKIALSFDFLPGITATGSKPDVATSLAEPVWYSVAEAAIMNVTKRFGPLRFLSLGFDEVLLFVLLSSRRYIQ